jgi:hypothetical protein
MTAPAPRGGPGGPPPGLCGDCRWARRVESGRGSVFLLCRRAEGDPAYRRYPPLPRLACPGHEPAGPGAGPG